MSLNKVWLTVHASNRSAIRTYTKLGFEIEGILRDEFWYHKKRLDVFYMGILLKNFDVYYSSITRQC